MVGGRLRCLSCFVACSSVLLLGVCLYDVEASNCQRVIHKKVGDTAELPSCLPTEGVTSAAWKYGGIIIADNDIVVSDKNRFKGRLNLNPTNFSLTIRELTLKDSGDFSFVSADDTQRQTVIISLHVHEPITEKPVLTSNSTWHNMNQSCTVLLECSAPNDGSVSYNWTVGGQTRSGSRQQYIVKMQDGDTEFTCTVYNFVSEMSASEIVNCSTNTQQNAENHLIFLVAGGAGAAFVIIVLVVAVVLCYCKQNQATGSDVNDLTVYADINEVASVDDPESLTKPCSVYETIDNRVTAVTPGPQTVYDKIQLSRVRKASVSPYQEIS